MDRAGNLYGAALAGGYDGGGCSNFYRTPGCGTVFQLSHSGSGWVLNPLYEFQGGNDSGNPEYSVTLGRDGAIYGVTNDGSGCNTGGECGTAFRLTPPPARCVSTPCTWRETVLHTFAGGADASLPSSPLIADNAGNLYGTTYEGGAYNWGTVYQLSGSGGNWAESVIYSFNAGQGHGTAIPAGPMGIDPAGNLYGAAACSDNLGCFYGVVWELERSQNGWTLDSLFQFNGGNGYSPTGVLRDSAGNLYGTTLGDGGNESAAVFELNRSAGYAYTQLYNYGGFGEGYTFYLAMDAAGNLYGSNSFNNQTFVFKLTKSQRGWAYSVVHTFSQADGTGPTGNMVFDSNGNLFGASLEGGSYGFGTIWEITP